MVKRRPKRRERLSVTLHAGKTSEGPHVFRGSPEYIDRHMEALQKASKEVPEVKARTMRTSDKSTVSFSGTMTKEQWERIFGKRKKK